MSEIEHFKQKIDKKHYRLCQICWIILSGVVAFSLFTVIDISVERPYSYILGMLIWIIFSMISLMLLKKGVSLREYGLDDRRLYFSQAFIKNEPLMELRTVKEIIITDKGYLTTLYLLPFSKPNIILYSAKNHQAALGVEDLDEFVLALKKILPNVPIRTESAE